MFARPCVSTTPITTSVNLIPSSEDDKNLAILLEANRVARGKRSARDVITVVAIYPDGGTTVLTGGKITDGVPGRPVASAGKQKSKMYGFAFENTVRA